MTHDPLGVRAIGCVESTLRDPRHAPKQGHEGAPAAWLRILPEFADAMRDLQVGDDVLVLTWLHHADRTTLRVHPRDDATAPLRGVFATRSADRPNPIGIHPVRIVGADGAGRWQVEPLEAVDGTPVIDIKPVL